MAGQTHYIPAFTERNGLKQRAVCGTWVRQDEHTVEPTCSTCARWLTADAAEAATFETVEAHADALFGPPMPAPTVVLNEFRSTDGYKPKGGAR